MGKGIRVMFALFLVGVALTLFLVTQKGSPSHGIFALALIIMSIILVIFIILPDSSTY